MHRMKIEIDLEYSKRLQKDANFIWEVKQDWYGLDFEYIKEKKDNVFSTKFIRIQNINDYIDYFPKGAFTLQIKYIQEFYQTKGKEFNPTGRYLTSFEMDRFVKVTSSLISKKLGTRLLRYSLKVKG